jgi:electron transport complex protein RnfB
MQVADEAAAIEALERLLPQTQCTQCGFDGCRPYAQAIVREQAPINRCPPGGSAGIAVLAAHTGRQAIPLDPSCGTEQPRRIARIVAELCIGCTKCITACPVDAIVGAPKRLHAVISDACTGCDLCVPPCPVDCIEMVQPPPALAAWTRADADAARERHLRRAERLQRVARDELMRRADRAESHLAELTEAQSAPAAATPDPAQARKRAVIEAAIARARARLTGTS